VQGGVAHTPEVVDNSAAITTGLIPTNVKAGKEVWFNVVVLSMKCPRISMFQCRNILLTNE